MKRAPIVLSGTAAGLVGVLAYHNRRDPVRGDRRELAGDDVQPDDGRRFRYGDVRNLACAGVVGKLQNTNRQRTGRQLSVRRSPGQGDHGRIPLRGHLVVRLDVTDPRSESIDQYAVPQLRQEAMSAQSAKIDGVSGASDTSAAYRQALQSALESWHESPGHEKRRGRFRHVSPSSEPSSPSTSVRRGCHMNRCAGP